MRYIKGFYGFINKPTIKVPSNTMLPPELREIAEYSDNLYLMGNNKPIVNGGGIGFKNSIAQISAFGEFVERYASSFQSKSGLIKGSYISLSKNYNCINPKKVNYYNQDQIQSDSFNLKIFTEASDVHWKPSKCYLSGQDILLPFFMVNVENIQGDGLFHINTTTGTAAHSTLPQAIQAGIIECIERDAFSKFWYKQNDRQYTTYSVDDIIQSYPDSTTIKRLYRNSRVKIVTFDISQNAYCPTFAVMIFFKRNGHLFQSIGSASRLTNREAIEKACIEAYQGIEYTQIVYDEALRIMDIEVLKKGDFRQIDNFRKHFAFYNVCPQYRNEVPIFREALELPNDFSKRIPETALEHHLNSFSPEELKLKGLGNIYYADLTTSDVKQLGLCVVKTIVPDLTLLTGDFNYPYLGTLNTEKSFTQFPHPFP